MEHKYSHHNRRKYSLKVHIVLVTKYRKPLLKGCIADDVKQKINDFLNRKDYDLIAIETVKEHIHLHHEKLLNFFLREHMFCIIIYYRKEERKFDFAMGVIDI